MNENTQQNNTNNNNSNKGIDKSNLIAYRLPANIIPVYEDIAKQVYQAGFIKRPDITALAKYGLNYFASAWVYQQQMQTRIKAEAYGSTSPMGKQTIQQAQQQQGQQQEQQSQQQQGEGQGE